MTVLGADAGTCLDAPVERLWVVRAIDLVDAS
jgi:hypothetical protein